MISGVSRLRPALLTACFLALISALAACATTTPSGSSSSSSPTAPSGTSSSSSPADPRNPGSQPGSAAAGAPNAAGARFDEGTIRVIRTYLEARGWQYLGVDSSPSAGQRLIFLSASSLARTDSTSRARQLDVFAAARDANAGLSRAYWLQFDCDRRVAQILHVEEFADQLATQRKATIGPIAQTFPVVARTSREAVMTRACAAQRPLPSTTPGVAPRGGSGSGVVIAPRLVLSNHHVVSRCSAIDVLLAGHRHPARLRGSNATSDLALLDVATLPETPTPALRAGAVIGEPVMVAGYPLQGVLSSDLIVTDGIVNSLSGLARNTTQLQVSAPVQPGNSGGPLLDRSGHLVGVVVAKLDALRALVLTGDIPQNINFAVRPEIVARFLADERVTVAQGSPDQRLDTQELARRANGFTVKVDCRP